MEYRKIATGMIEAFYEMYKSWKEDKQSVNLNRYGKRIPVWCDMDKDIKCIAIEYVYYNRNTIELHSGCVQAWVQATAYFMLYSFAKEMMTYSGKVDVDIFFDDMDFFTEMSEYSKIKDVHEYHKLMRIKKDFFEPLK